MEKKLIGIYIAICVLVLIFIGTGLAVVYQNVIVPNQKYNEAMLLIEKGEYVSAYDLLSDLGDYKDSQAKKAEIYDRYAEYTRFSTLQIGETVCVGEYEQDNNINNGPEKIEWIVIAKEQGKALVVSKYALDAVPYHNTNDRVFWESSTLRQWLNESFFQTSFTEEEQSGIVLSNVQAHDYPNYATVSGNHTYDNIFLLSYVEIREYMPEISDRFCPVTEYAKAQGVHESADGACRWWTRTSGGLQDRAAFVRYNGQICALGHFVNTPNYGVRPAMWIGI